MPKNLFDLTGKVALITGGNGGIGLGFAEGVAKQGADVCIWGRNAQKNSAVLAQLTEFGTKVHPGVAKSGRFEEFSTEDWRHVMDVNLDGLFYTLRCAAKHMKQRAEAGDPGGRLIATSSLGALMGMARVEAYGASKGAVISMMQGLAVEYARWGVTANSILPGHIETAMTTDNYANEKFANAILPRIPARRWGDRSDFEGIAAYLMSDASSYHTGDSLLIDGGFFLY